MKRKFSLVLSVIMLLGAVLCSCGSEKSIVPPAATARPTEDMYNAAMYYIAQGNYEMGYAALLSISTYEKAAEALKDFYHLPGQIAERKEGETNPDNYDITKFSYGKNGIILEREYNESGIVTGTETFKYENGLLKTSSFKSNGDNSYTASYTFDGEGRLSEIFMTDVEENFARTEYKYDAAGKVTEEIETDYDGTVTTSKFSYGEDGKVSVKRSYRVVDGAETLAVKCEYTYNEKGVLIGANKTADGKKFEVGYSSHRLFYAPDYRDLMMYY